MFKFEESASLRSYVGHPKCEDAYRWIREKLSDTTNDFIVKATDFNDRIEPYGDEGKYKVIFKSPAQAIGPIPIGSAPQGTMQGPRYTSHKKLLAATSVGDLVPWG